MEQQESGPTRVTVTDVDIGFGSMVWLLVKFAFASIPAALIVALIVVFAIAVLRGMS